MESYPERLRNIICKEVNAQDYEHPLSDNHIIVDAGNGVGGFFAESVLKPLGADITGSQFLEPDGMFPNHIPNPENQEAMKSICDATVRAHADLGIIFDTDVDRAGCVDKHGQPINRNRLIALASYIALQNCPGGTIVTDSVTSDGLKYYIESILGGHHHRFKRGYKNVINESLRLNREGTPSPLAIETSGHAALQENYFLDDGAYLMVKIIILMATLKKQGQDLTDVIVPLPEPAESVELRLKILHPNFATYGHEVLSSLETYAKEQGWQIAEDSHEGIRISFDKNHGNGWLVLRLSVHDPEMPLNIESNQAGGCKRIYSHLKEFLSSKKLLSPNTI